MGKVLKFLIVSDKHGCRYRIEGFVESIREEIPGLGSQTVVGEGPGLAPDPAQVQEVDGACALAMGSMTGMRNQLRVELVPQPPGLQGGAGLGLGAVDRVEVASEKPKKPKKIRSSPGDEAAEGAASHWEHHDEKWPEYEVLVRQKQWGAAQTCIGSLLAKGRDVQRQFSTKLLPVKRRELGTWVVEYGLQVRECLVTFPHDAGDLELRFILGKSY